MRARLRIFGITLLMSVFAAGPLFAESSGANGFISERLERIDAAINAEIEDGRIPGAVALVLKDGEVAYLSSFGAADLASQTPMETGHIFRLASMTKAITTVAAMILYERGHFQLNDPISKWLPQFADMQVVSETDAQGKVTATVAAENPIRIIDLMAHTAGISYPFIPSAVQQAYVDAGIIDGVTSREMTLASQMELLAGQPLLFEPGAQFAYGLNTDLLGHLIEVVSGQSLAAFLSAEIFGPLAMHDTHFYLPPEKAERLVTLYAAVDGDLVVSQGNESSIVFDDPLYPLAETGTYYSGGGGLSGTARDYGRFLQMLLNDGTLDGQRILSRKSVELMRTARVDWDEDGKADMGLGFQVIGDLGGSGELGSVGAYSWGGAFNTTYWIDPGEGLVGVFMSQVRPVDSDISTRFKTLVYQALE